MATSPEQSLHTSAYDRHQSEQGKLIDTAAFDLVLISTKSAGKAIRETAVDELHKQPKAKKCNPTGRKIRRDGWLSPLTLDCEVLAQQTQAHRDGLRASDKGFLQVDWESYYALLRWTAKQSMEGIPAKVPSKHASLLASLGIDVSMRRDWVWYFKKDFG